jgi:uncharacterized membrane protein
MGPLSEVASTCRDEGAEQAAALYACLTHRAYRQSDAEGESMATTPPKDTPFGLEPNVAAGLAYILGIIGGIIMLVGGGTNKFVKWAAAQSITLFIAYIAFYIAVFILDMILGMVHLFPIVVIIGLVSMLVGLLFVVAYIYAAIMAFTGKEVRLPIIADFTTKFFGSQL